MVVLEPGLPVQDMQPGGLVSGPDMRAYATREARVRLHQQRFKLDVMRAYHVPGGTGGVSPVGASSSVPSFTSTASSLTANTREPQTGQKLRPSQVLYSPVDSNAERGQMAKVVNMLPLSWRQEVQWQSPTRTGSPLRL